MPDWWIGGVEIVLGAVTVVLTALAILIGILAVWGYRDIRAAALRTAETEARRVAEEVAAREFRAYMDTLGTGEDISAAYRDHPNG